MLIILHLIKPSARNWLSIVLVLGFIFLSSSGAAGTAADFLFKDLYRIIVGLPEAGHRFLYRSSYLLAEKTLHVAMFMALSCLLSRSFSTGITLTAAAIVGIFSEYLQAFFPNRDPELADCVINMAGAIAGVVLYRCFGRAEHVR